MCVGMTASACMGVLTHVRGCDFECVRGCVGNAATAEKKKRDVLARTSVIGGRVLLNLEGGAEIVPDDVTIDGDLDLSCPPSSPPPVLGGVAGTEGGALHGTDALLHRHSATQQVQDGCWGDALRVRLSCCRRCTVDALTMRAHLHMSARTNTTPWALCVGRHATITRSRCCL